MDLVQVGLPPVIEDGGDPSCCTGPQSVAFDAQAALALAERFKALADPSRLQLLAMVLACDSACICDLTGPVGLTQPTVSHHMKVLVEAGLLHREKRGKWVHFSADREALQDLAMALAEPDAAHPRSA